MSDAYEQIEQGLTEALAFARGDAGGAVVHEIAVPSVDGMEISATTGGALDPLPRFAGEGQPSDAAG